MNQNSTGTIRFSDLDFKNKDQVRAFVEQCCTEKKSNNDLFERECLFNIAWYMGLQNLLMDGRTGQLVRYERDDMNPRLVYNKILPLTDARLAMIGFEPVYFESEPATDNVADQNTARTRSKVLAYYSEKLALDTFAEENDRWMVLAGESFVKVTWDPYLGAEFDPLEETGMSEAEYKAVYDAEADLTMGDVCLAHVPAINLYWGPRGVSFEDAEWVLEVNERSRGYVRDRYDLSDAQMAEVGDGEDQALVYRVSDIGPTGISRRMEDCGDTVIVKELWVKRCPRHRKGKHVVVAGKLLIRNQDNPYLHGEIPYSRFRDQIVPGRERGMSVVSNARGPQSDYNANMNQQVMNRTLMANPRWWARKGSITNFDEVTSSPGGFGEFIGDSPPALSQGAAMPASTMVNLQKTERDLQDIFGVHDVSQAKVPSGVKSGVAIAQLKEADNQRFNLHARRRRESWERVGMLLLRTLNQFVQEERVAKILGEENRWETIKYTGEMLAGKMTPAGVNQWDVRVRTTGRPRSHISLLEDIRMLSETGYLTAMNPDDKRTVFKAFEIGGSMSADPKDADRRRAGIENDEMLNSGQPVPVRSMDDDVTHQEEHNWRRKQEDFRNLPVEIQAAFEIHNMQHEVNKAKKAMIPQLAIPQAMKELGLAPPQAGPGGPTQPSPAQPPA